MLLLKRTTTNAIIYHPVQEVKDHIKASKDTQAN